MDDQEVSAGPVRIICLNSNLAFVVQAFDCFQTISVCQLSERHNVFSKSFVSLIPMGLKFPSLLIVSKRNLDAFLLQTIIIFRKGVGRWPR